MHLEWSLLVLQNFFARIENAILRGLPLYFAEAAAKCQFLQESLLSQLSSRTQGSLLKISRLLPRKPHLETPVNFRRTYAACEWALEIYCPPIHYQPYARWDLKTTSKVLLLIFPWSMLNFIIVWMAEAKHGTQIIDKTTRNRIFNSRYWKEECFALNAESFIDKAVLLKCIGGLYGGAKKPTKFLCLLFKMLQMNLS